MDKGKKLKLVIELVPSTCWYSNLRKEVTQTEWDKIRKEAYAKAGYHCEICGAEGKLNCHEIWGYNDKTSMQKLKGFQALCDNCHNIKHMGFVNVQINKGKWPESRREELAQHFMKVNQVPREEFDEHVTKAFEEWGQRSQKEWKTDLGDFNKDNGQKNLDTV